jgi:hypothetical protein
MSLVHHRHGKAELVGQAEVQGSLKGRHSHTALLHPVDQLLLTAEERAAMPEADFTKAAAEAVAKAAGLAVK